MYTNYKSHLDSLLNEIKEAGLYKNERIIISPQGAEIELNTGQKVLNSVPIIISDYQIILPLLKQRKHLSTIMVMGCRR